MGLHSAENFRGIACRLSQVLPALKLYHLYVSRPGKAANPQNPELHTLNPFEFQLHWKNREKSGKNKTEPLADATQCEWVSAPQNHVVTPHTSRPISWHGDSHHVPEPRRPSQEFETNWCMICMVPGKIWRSCRAVQLSSLKLINDAEHVFVRRCDRCGHQLNWTACALKRLFLKP